MGADGAIHIYTIKDLGAMEELQRRFDVNAYVYANFLREGLHVAWEFCGDCPMDVGQNIHRFDVLLGHLHPDQHPEWRERNFKEWVRDLGVDWETWSLYGVDDTATVGEFLDLWDRAIEDYEGEWEVWS